MRVLLLQTPERGSDLNRLRMLRLADLVSEDRPHEFPPSCLLSVDGLPAGCETAAVSYHETFWLAAATAAPVIALAAVVAMPDVSIAAYEIDEAASDAMPAATEAHALLTQIFEKAHEGRDEPFEMRPLTKERVSAVPGIATFVNVLVQAALLAVALSALATAHNVLPPWVAIVLAVGGILLLTVTTRWVVMTRSKAAFFQSFSRRRGDG